MRTTGPTPMLGAISGFLCVAIGAFGAHALKDGHARELIETGVRYHLAHTMACFASISFCNWGAIGARRAPPFFLLGIGLFSGSLYALALGGPKWLAYATPLGGLCFLVGWILMMLAGFSLYRKGAKTT